MVKNILPLNYYEYSIFYIRFIEKIKNPEPGYWLTMQQNQSYKVWIGYSFENLCIKHVSQIKEALKISGIHSIQGSWFNKNKDNAAQIDLLIDRNDNVINICEIKFYNSMFTIDKNYMKVIENKILSFRNTTKTRKNIFVTLITTYGITENEYSKQIVQNNLKLEHLFSKLYPAKIHIFIALLAEYKIFSNHSIYLQPQSIQTIIQKLNYILFQNHLFELSS